jgi:hypothetical protein
MKPERVETLRHGMVAGILGYAVVVAFFAAFNALEGRSIFHTAAVLGSFLFYGARTLDQVSLGAGPVLSYNGVHLLVFIAYGVIAAWLADLSERGPHLWYVSAILMITFAFHLFGVLLGVSVTLNAVIPAWSLLVSGLLGSAAVTGYLVWSHPALRHSLTLQAGEV